VHYRSDRLYDVQQIDDWNFVLPIASQFYFFLIFSFAFVYRENELRRRERQEKKESTQDLVNNIKQKMKENERRNALENKVLMYLGVAAAVASCVVAAYRWWSG